LIPTQYEMRMVSPAAYKLMHEHDSYHIAPTITVIPAFSRFIPAIPLVIPAKAGIHFARY
jgi:hypothetical protein